MLIINTQLMHGNHIYNSEVHERVYIYIYTKNAFFELNYYDATPTAGRVAIT
jgi:hypothetical protein